MLDVWKENSRENKFSKYGRRIDEVNFTLPDGSKEDFYLLNEGETVAILALSADNEVLLARQYRPGPNKILLELPGGGVEADETLHAAIERELLEETGYVGKASPVGQCYDDAYSNRVRHVFVATDCRKVGEPMQTPTEHIEVTLMSLLEFRQHIRSGELSDVAAAYMGLDYLGLL